MGAEFPVEITMAKDDTDTLRNHRVRGSEQCRGVLTGVKRCHHGRRRVSVLFCHVNVVVTSLSSINAPRPRARTSHKDPLCAVGQGDTLVSVTCSPKFLNVYTVSNAFLDPSRYSPVAA